jgi:hypothetical protein
VLQLLNIQEQSINAMTEKRQPYVAATQDSGAINSCSYRKEELCAADA